VSTVRTVKADVAVVGAGPSGSAAAVYLARDGIAVLVLERTRFPREKVCGDALTPRAVTVLADLGVEDQLRDLGYQPYDSLRLVSSRGDSVVGGFPEYGKGGRYGYVVPRIVLDRLLMEASRGAGARILEETEALSLEQGAGGQSDAVLRARTTGGEELRVEAQVIIAADGSRGSFSRTVLGADRTRPGAIAIRGYAEGVNEAAGHLHFFLDSALLPGGYGWIFPSGHPEEPANVGVGLTMAQAKRKGQRPSQLLEAFLSAESLARRHMDGAHLVTRPAAFPLLMGVCRGRRMLQGVLFVGDAAHLVDPLSGQGIAYALESGHSAAAAVALALHTGRHKHLFRYPLHVFFASVPDMLSARALRVLLARPWCNQLVVRALSRDEALARAGVAVLANSIPAYGVFHPALLGRLIAPRRLVSIAGAQRSAAGPPA
jgi:geranylgeranyl reductase family protein